MPKIGYARVSSSSQDLDIQNAKLVAAGCEVIRSETDSGASRDDRFRGSWANMDGGVVAPWSQPIMLKFLTTISTTCRCRTSRWNGGLK